MPQTREIGWRHWLACLAIVAVTAVVLLAMGREPICTCGTVKLWHGVVESAENSQHLSDWYSPTHVVHGIMIFFAAGLLLRRLSFGARLIAGLLVECVWEVVENTDWVIQYYRDATISLDYYGDSVVNSVADIAAMAIGFWIARRARWWVSVALVVAIEGILAATIRDNLLLNILMLIHPVDAVRQWQLGG
jgi:hypothetical protein